MRSRWMRAGCRWERGFASTSRIALQTSEIGAVAPGAYADIIALRGDPLKDIAELGRAVFVMKDGAVFKDERTER